MEGESVLVQVSDRTVRKVRSRGVALEVSERMSPRSRSLTILLISVSLGALSGLLELGLLAGQRWVSGTVTTDLLEVNRHLLWMIPAAEAILLTILGCLVSAVAFRWPKRGARAALWLIVFTATLAPLMSIRGLYPWACVLLAGGVAVRASAWLNGRLASLRRPASYAVPVLAAIVGGLLIVDYRFVTRAEAAALAARPAARAEAPNVLFIVLDTVRAESMSLYGHGRDTTPNLNGLAKRGVRFDVARSTAPWTLPSHASMFTGRWPHELSVGLTHPLDSQFPTLAEFLSAHGYATGGFVANTHFCHSQFGLGRGFAHYEDRIKDEEVSAEAVALSSIIVRRVSSLFASSEPVVFNDYTHRRTSAEINTAALEWLSHRNRQPFFMFLNYMDAHGPYYPPKDYQLQFSKKHDSDRAYYLLSEVQSANKAAVTKDEADHFRRAAELFYLAYDDCLAALDRNVGKLLGELDRRKLLANTWIIVTADHGEHLGEHLLYSHGCSLYRQLVHVPLLIVPPPSIFEAKSVKEPVSLRDLPATIADVLDLERDSPFPGKSLAPFWNDKGTVQTDPVLFELNGHVDTEEIGWSQGPRHETKGLTAWGHTFILNEDGSEELYALENDRYEEHNLVAKPENQEILQRFRKLMVKARGAAETRPEGVVAADRR